MGRGIFSIIIGLVFIIGGLTGQMVLVGTQSGGALAVVGVIIAAVGVFRIVNANN